MTVKVLMINLPYRVHLEHQIQVTNENKGKESASSQSSKNKASSRKEKESSTDKSLDRLAKIISTGFSELKDLFKESNEPNNNEYEDCYDQDFCEDLEDISDDDMFDNIAGDIVNGETVGPDVRHSLASLTDKLLQLKISDTMIKDKKEKHLRPKNVEFLNTPRVNKPIWENLASSTRVKESQLQSIHKDLLTSAIPTVKVMEKIFEHKDNMAALDPKEIIDTLKDSIMFLGCANVGMIKIRRENVRRDLPKNMQGLCREEVEFSGSQLFGDNLNATIKDVSELNKISTSLKPRGIRPSRGQRRGVPFRGRGRVLKRLGRGRFSSGRFTSYGTRKMDEKRTLNYQSPSNK